MFINSACAHQAIGKIACGTINFISLALVYPVIFAVSGPHLQLDNAVMVQMDLLL